MTTKTTEKNIKKTYHLPKLSQTVVVWLKFNLNGIEQGLASLESDRSTEKRSTGDCIAWESSRREVKETGNWCFSNKINIKL